MSEEIVALDEVRTFPDLAAAEEALLAQAEQQRLGMLEMVRIVRAIQSQRLFTQATDPNTGQPFQFFEDYKPYLAEKIEREGRIRFRTLMNWVTRERVLVEAAGYTPQILTELGSHAAALMEAANVGYHDKELAEEDAVQPDGTLKLGRERFTKLVDEVRERVTAAKDNPSPELHWDTGDTRALVRQATGKPPDVHAVWEVKETEAGMRLSVTWWVGETPYHATVHELVPKAHLALLTKRDRVMGYDTG